MKLAWELQHWITQQKEDEFLIPSGCAFCGNKELVEVRAGWLCKVCMMEINAVSYYQGANAKAKQLEGEIKQETLGGEKMNIIPLKDADFDLVELADDGNIGKLTPHCKKHRAMLKLTENGIWRCMTTYRYDKKTMKLYENNCKAGCQEYGFSTI